MIARALRAALRWGVGVLLLVGPLSCAALHRARDVAEAQRAAAASYAVALDALQVADAAANVVLDGDDARQADVALARAHALLERAHAAGADAGDALQDIRDAVLALRVVAALLGDECPAGLVAVLSVVEDLLGEAEP